MSEAKLPTYKKKKVYLSLREDLLKKAKATAIMQDTSLSAVVNELLEQWLKQQKEKTA